MCATGLLGSHKTRKPGAAYYTLFDMETAWKQYGFFCYRGGRSASPNAVLILISKNS